MPRFDASSLSLTPPRSSPGPFRGSGGAGRGAHGPRGAHEARFGGAQLQQRDARREYEAQVKEFFAAHRSDGWLVERYDPAYMEQRWEEGAAAARTAAAAFAAAYQADPSIVPPCDATAYKLLDYDKEEEQGNKEQANKEEEEENKKENKDEKDEKEQGEEKKEEEKEKELEEGEIEQQAPMEEEKKPLLPLPRPCQHVLAVRIVPRAWSQADVAGAFGGLAGCVGVAMSDPDPQCDYARTAWVLFASAAACDAALAALAAGDGRRVRGTRVAAARFANSDIVVGRAKQCPPECSAPAQVRDDVARAARLAAHLDAEKGVAFPGPEALAGGAEAWAALPPARQLDFWLHYLRTVHSTCFYCAEEFANAACLQWRCGPLHLRAPACPALEARPLAQLQTPWLAARNARLDARMGHRINAGLFDTAADTSTVADAFHRRNTIAGPDGAYYGCALCPKRFAAPAFVHKHHLLRHAAELDKAKHAALTRRMEVAFLDNPVFLPPHITRLAAAAAAAAAAASSSAASATPPVLPILLPPRPGAHISKERVYDGFLAAASLSEPQHTIYDS